MPHGDRVGGMVAPHDVEVDIPVDAVDGCAFVGLPDPPSLDVRTDQHAPMPDGPVQIVTDVVAVLEVGPDVEDDGLTGRALHLLEEDPELALDPRSLRALRAIARQLEVDHRREGGGQVLEAVWVACQFNATVRLVDTFGLRDLNQLADDALPESNPA
jgi:hypothetical protein